MSRAAWKPRAARRTPARSSNSFGACALKMQGHPAEGSWGDYALPDAAGHFGPYGGVFVAETLLGATVVPVSSGSRTLKDALNEAMRDWVTNVENTFYIIGTVAGPHPYPMMVRDFNSIVGKECVTQMPAMSGRQPDAVLACVGGGSNAMGIFHSYIPHEEEKLVGVEAGGPGPETGKLTA